MMTPRIKTLNRLAGTCALALLLATPAYAEGPLLISMDPVVDIGADRAELENWRKAEQQKLVREGKASSAEFRRIDQQMLEKARALEAKRTEALKILSEKSGFTNLGQGSGGTLPAEGRGILGDIDTNSLSPKEFDKAFKAAEAAGYKPVRHGDGFKIPGLDVTVHRAPAGETVSSPVGSSGRSAEIARGNNPETAYGLGKKDPALAVPDNLKKGAHTLTHTPETLINNPEELQKLGKMTQRNLAAINDVHGAAAPPTDPALKAKLDALKEGMSPGGAGIVDPAAPPAEQAKQMADFQKQVQKINVEAVKAADTHAAKTMDGLAGKVREAGEALEAAKASGNATQIAEAQKTLTNANKAVIEYSELRGAAQHAATVNDPHAANVVNEARGIKPEGSSPSQVRDAAVAGERKALTEVIKEPAKPPEAARTATAEPVKPGVAAEPVKTPGATAEPVKTPGGTVEPVKPTGVAEPVKAPAGTAAGPKSAAAGEGAAATAAGEGAGLKGQLKSAAAKGAGILMAGYMIYHGVTRGAEEAGKAAAAKGDSTATSVAKTAGYSLWHGLGFGAAKEIGQKAGEESAQKWAQDVKEGKVDPNSKLSQTWAQIRAVGWGLAEFTGLQAIKDATVEGAGLVKDKYTQYQAEKAAAAAQANKPADTKAGDAKPGDAKPGDAKPGDAKPATADKTTPPAPGDKDKAGGDRTAGDKTAGDKTKPGDAKPGDAKTADGKPADGKPADSKDAAKDPAKDPANTADKDKPAGDKDRPKPPVNIGGAITAAGVSTLKQPPKPPVPTTLPVLTPPPPPPPPPAPATTEVEGGWLQDSKGKTKVVYIQNEKGERIGGYYVHYDPQGRETGRETFSEKPDTGTQQQVSATLTGSYRGAISGKASGAISFSVNGSSISGTVNGVFEGDSFSSRFSGTLNPDGSFNAPAQGVLQGNLNGKISPYAFSGHVAGRITGSGGSGTWSGRNQWGGGSGSWQARK